MYEHFSERLRQLRVSKRMTQKQLADRLEISKSTVSSYENTGKQKYPSLDVLQKIAVVLDTNVEYLLGLENRQWIIVDGLSDRNINKIRSMILDYKRSNEKEV